MIKWLTKDLLSSISIVDITITKRVLRYFIFFFSATNLPSWALFGHSQEQTFLSDWPQI